MQETIVRKNFFVLLRATLRHAEDGLYSQLFSSSECEDEKTTHARKFLTSFFRIELTNQRDNTHDENSDDESSYGKRALSHLLTDVE